MDYQINWKNLHGMTGIPTQALAYIKEVPGDYLRVLLLLFSESSFLSPEEISNKLSIPKSNVNNSIRYWIEKGLLSFPEENIVEKSAFKKPSASSITSEELTEAFDSDPQARLLFENAELLYGRPLKPLERRNLLYILQNTLLPVDVILMIIDFCVRMDKLSPRYLLSVCEDWADRNINSHELAEEQIQFLTEKTERERLVVGCFGIHNRRLTKKESDYIEKWFCDYSYSISIIQKAYEKTVDYTGKLSFPYLNKVLTSWYNEGIKTPEEAAEQEIKTPKTQLYSERETSYNLDELSMRGLFVPEE